MQAERSETLEQELEEFYQAHPDRYHPFLWREREQLLADGTDLERGAGDGCGEPGGQHGHQDRGGGVVPVLRAAAPGGTG